MSHYNSNLQAILARAQAAVDDALADISDDLLRESNSTAPLDTGVMINSGESGVEAGTGKARVAYGGAADAYVVRQHEDLSLRHKPGRRALFLQRAAEENEQRYAQRMQAILRQQVT